MIGYLFLHFHNLILFFWDCMRVIVCFFLIYFLIGVQKGFSLEQATVKNHKENRVQESAHIDLSELKKLKSKLKKRRIALLSPHSNKKFSRIYKLMRKKDSTKKAISLLKKIIASPGSPSSEKLQALRDLGIAYSGLNNYKKAIFYFEKSLSSPVVHFDQYMALLINVSQIYLADNNVTKAREYLNRWFNMTDRKKAQPYVLMSFVHYMEGDKNKALEKILRAINMTKKPDKRWLTFASSLYLQFKNYKKAEALLSRSLVLYPASTWHWKTLSLAQFENNKRKETLASFQLADKVQPLSKEAGVIHLVRLFLDQDLPYQAGQVLKKAIKEKKIKANQKNYEILGDCWMNAEEIEQALLAYKEASKKTKDDGSIWVKLGLTYFNQGNWSQAAKSMEKGVEMGKVNRLDEVYMQIGLSYYRLKKYTSAIYAFEKAEELEGNYEITARKWIRQAQTFL